MKKIISLLILIIIIPRGMTAQDKIETTFTETELLLKTPTGNISGTISVPVNVRKSPVVIIIAGSGPTDRDGNSPLGVKAGSYKMLAEGLAEYGISVLRYDKRAIGKSQAAATSESELRFETYINDVVDWIALLKKDKRFSKIILIGHSEGSLIGMVAANKTKISKYISVAGPGKPADKIIHEQLKNQVNTQILEESDRVMDSLRAGKTVSQFNPVLISLYRPSVQPYMISWIKYDPAAEIKKLRMPVMIIQGTTDLQVLVEDAKLLSEAKPNARLLLIDNMNHILKEADADRQKNLATYSDPDLPLKSGLTDEIAKFIKSGK